MDNKIESMYKATTRFEFSVAINGMSYLVIYGTHINGYWCCVPGFHWGCEMSAATDVGYNTNKLISCGASEFVATEIARAIQSVSEKIERATK